MVVDIALRKEDMGLAINDKATRAWQAIDESRILKLLDAYQPEVVSTIMVGLDTDSSDIDIVCYHRDSTAFESSFHAAFKTMAGYELYHGSGYLVGRFFFREFEFEVYSTATPVKQQAGYRHFQIMKRLCLIAGDGFRLKIKSLKLSGLKTEPAICHLFGLSGDPYKSVLSLEDWPDQKIVSLLQDVL